MKISAALILLVVLLAVFTDASPIVQEKQAKQILRTKRSERERKAGHPDEPMREYMLYLQRLEQRSEEQFYEHWWNPHCQPHCNRNLVHPV
ncbi:PREDICTED: uncharacterized protein C17orf67 homolog [Nanorana parkeri]|uniref:uncharacterized protein C17orf67 homolog n=1 Tax=Nanorana parkeri TaxID=125878 RepID=UPI000854C81A|nr:PREDICTED: uncharacterized protein C17orf67 homolog [Nanorana parkeri]